MTCTKTKLPGNEACCPESEIIGPCIIVPIPPLKPKSAAWPPTAQPSATAPVLGSTVLNLSLGLFCPRTIGHLVGWCKRGPEMGGCSCCCAFPFASSSSSWNRHSTPDISLMIPMPLPLDIWIRMRKDQTEKRNPSNILDMEFSYRAALFLY